MNSCNCRRFFRFGGAALLILGGALLTAYMIRWWPYAHREDFQLTVLWSNGSASATSGVIPMPLVPCLLLGAGLALLIASIVATTRRGKHP